MTTTPTTEDYVAREEARLLRTMNQVGKNSAASRPRSWSVNREAQEFKLLSDQIHKNEQPHKQEVADKHHHHYTPTTQPINFGARVEVSPPLNHSFHAVSGGANGGGINREHLPSPVFNFEPVRRSPSPSPTPVRKEETTPQHEQQPQTQQQQQSPPQPQPQPQEQQQQQPELPKSSELSQPSQPQQPQQQPTESQQQKPLSIEIPQPTQQQSQDAVPVVAKDVTPDGTPVAVNTAQQQPDGILSEKVPTEGQQITISKEAEERQVKAEEERFSRYLGRASAHARSNSGSPGIHAPIVRKEAPSPRFDLHINPPISPRSRDTPSPPTVLQQKGPSSPRQTPVPLQKSDSSPSLLKGSTGLNQKDSPPTTPTASTTPTSSASTSNLLKFSNGLQKEGAPTNSPVYRRQGSNSFSYHTRSESQDKNFSPNFASFLPRTNSGTGSPVVRKESASPRVENLSVAKPLSIDKSPRQSVVLEISGNGSTKGEAGKSTSFVIKSKSINISDASKSNVTVSVKITAKNAEGKVVEIPNNVHLEADGYHVTYTPSYIGAHTVEIFVGPHLAHTITVPVYEGGPHALNTEGTYFMLKNAMVGIKAQLIVTPMSYIKRLVPLGYSSLSATVAHVESNTFIKNVSVLGNKEGHHVVSFYPAQVGEHIISVTLNGQHISGSPFVFHVIAEQSILSANKS